MGWTIGRYRIEETLALGRFFIQVDGERLPVAGERTLEFGKSKIRVCQVQQDERWTLELWVGLQRIPRSPASFERINAPAGSACSRHGLRRSPSYRASAKPPVPAKIVCAGCGDKLCRDCTSVDRVRCYVCLETALLAEENADATRNLVRGSFFGVAGILVGAFTIATALAMANPAFAYFGGGLLAIGVVKFVFELKQKRRAPKAPPEPPLPAAEEGLRLGDKPMSPLTRGIVLLCLAAVMTYLGVIAPIREAAAKAASVSVLVNASFFVPAAGVYGLAFLLAPNWTTEATTNASRSRSGSLVYGAPMLFLGWLLYEYVKGTIVGHGYVFK